MHTDGRYVSTVFMCHKCFKPHTGIRVLECGARGPRAKKKKKRPKVSPRQNFPGDILCIMRRRSSYICRGQKTVARMRARPAPASSVRERTTAAPGTPLDGARSPAAAAAAAHKTILRRRLLCTTRHATPPCPPRSDLYDAHRRRRSARSLDQSPGSPPPPPPLLTAEQLLNRLFLSLSLSLYLARASVVSSTLTVVAVVVVPSPRVTEKAARTTTCKSTTTTAAAARYTVCLLNVRTPFYFSCRAVGTNPRTGTPIMPKNALSNIRRSSVIVTRLFKLNNFLNTFFSFNNLELVF